MKTRGSRGGGGGAAHNLLPRSRWVARGRGLGVATDSLGFDPKVRKGICLRVKILIYITVLSLKNNSPGFDTPGEFQHLT